MQIIFSFSIENRPPLRVNGILPICRSVDFTLPFPSSSSILVFDKFRPDGRHGRRL